MLPLFICLSLALDNKVLESQNNTYSSCNLSLVHGAGRSSTNVVRLINLPTAQLPDLLNEGMTRGWNLNTRSPDGNTLAGRQMPSTSSPLCTPSSFCPHSHQPPPIQNLTGRRRKTRTSSVLQGHLKGHRSGLRVDSDCGGVPRAAGCGHLSCGFRCVCVGNNCDLG